eukprot:1598104-Prymnesium_polylepis.1
MVVLECVLSTVLITSIYMVVVVIENRARKEEKGVSRDFCESECSHMRPLHPQSCTIPHSARQRPSRSCGDPPASESRSSTNLSCLKQLHRHQGVKACRTKKCCREASEDSSCARERRQACEKSLR